MIQNADAYHDDGRQDLESWEIEDYVRDYCDAISCEREETKREEVMTWLTDEFGDLSIFSNVDWVISAINTDESTKLDSTLEKIRDFAIQCIRNKAGDEL